MNMSRRELFKHAARTGAGIAIVGSGSVLAEGVASGTPAGGYGPLVADPAGLLDLPPGFSYNVVSRSADWVGVVGAKAHAPDKLTGAWSSVDVPNEPDGAGAFADGLGNTVLVVNHELGGAANTAGMVPNTNGVPTYDSAVGGGTTTLVVDSTGTRLSQIPSLSGTIRNCAGGVTPWGTWLTCEETEAYTASTDKRHGYIFEVDPTGAATVATPYTAMGRMAHEAVAIDPASSTVYLTEDAGSPLGLFYKFVPTDTSKTYGSLGNGGTLYAMKAETLLNLAQVTTVGSWFNVSWVPVPTPDPASNTLSSSGAGTRLRNQFTDSQVTRSNKLEGCWWGRIAPGKTGVWFAAAYATSSGALVNGGVAHVGQIWTYDPILERIRLEAIFQPGGLFDSPDNVLVSPFGGAFLCEDGDGDQYVIGLDGNNTAFAFAQNKLEFPGIGDYEEFAGAVFSPNNTQMFVNIMGAGTVYCISGPWGEVESVEAPGSTIGSVALPLGATVVAAGVAGAVALRNRRSGAAPA